MKKFDIQPILESSLPEVASFLRRWRDDRDEESSIKRPHPEDALTTERRLRWLLVENPLAAGVSQHGFCLRDASGVIRGLDLSFPAAFLAADQRLLGLCSGAFFVEPQARMLGFYLFKRYLSTPGYSFYFATTCNANSRPVWQAVGASAVPNHETQYILPLRLDVLLPAWLSHRTPSRAAAGMARVLGRCANPVLQLLAQKSADLTIEPCRDWEKLSELFRRHKSAHWITADRSAVFLQWRYAQNSPNHPTDICLFRDKRGNEGWFSLGNIIVWEGQIRGRVLLDAIWPREKMRFRDIFPTILRLVASKTDAIYFQQRPGVDYGECSPWIISRRGAPPTIFAVTPKGGAPLAVSSLDFVPADGDSAFRISGWPERFEAR